MKKLFAIVACTNIFSTSVKADALSVLSDTWHHVKSLTKTEKLSLVSGALEAVGTVNDATDMLITFRNLREEQKGKTDKDIEGHRMAAMEALETRKDPFGKAVTHVMRPVVNMDILTDRLVQARTDEERIKAGEAINEFRATLTRSEFEPKEEGLNAAILSFGGPTFQWIGSLLDAGQYGWKKGTQPEVKAVTRIATLPSPSPISQQPAKTATNPNPNTTAEPPKTTEVDCDAPNAPADKCPEKDGSAFKWRLVSARSATTTDPDAYTGEWVDGTLLDNLDTACHFQPGLLDDAHQVIQLMLEMASDDSFGCSKAKNISVTDNSIRFERFCRTSGYDQRYRNETIVKSNREYTSKNTTEYVNGQFSPISYIEEYERCD